jgi:hypothetical protein
MFTPFAPSAGPIGGDGLAAPPFTCNFMSALTSLAILFVIESRVLVVPGEGKHYVGEDIPGGNRLSTVFILFLPACN